MPPTRKLSDCQTCNRSMAWVPTPDERLGGMAEQQTRTECLRCVRRRQRRPDTAHGRAEILPADNILDELAVRRAMKGDTTLRLTRRELSTAIVRMLDDECTLAEVASTLGLGMNLTVDLRDYRYTDLCDVADIA